MRSAEDKAKRAAYMREWNRRNPDKVWRSVLKKLYDMTPEEYNALLAAQGGVCALCEKTCKTGQRLSVDHNHTTGKIRGLLCRSCNSLLGAFKDDPALMTQAQAYLIRWGKGV